MRLFQLFSAMTRWERWLIAAFLVVALLSLGVLLRRFSLANTVLMPGSGGSYIEGSVGELQPLNPWFNVQNDVNRDIVSLVFSGLLKYNPQTRRIEDDLATLNVSRDNKVYTLKLKDDLFWHDSTDGEPHPVTADDVVFTFKTIQDPTFPNALLQQNFRGVRVDKVDNRTVQFTLEQPYSFFTSNLTLGLLPARSFEGIPVAKLSEALDFGYAPVGAGPYRVKTIVNTDLSTEVTLERFVRSITPIYRLDQIVFRIFADYSSLLSDLRNLQGVRLVPRNETGDPILSNKFTPMEYTLPQYVALFFNLDRPALQDQKLRLGLQLGTNKQAVADAIQESVIVDTPLLEIDTADWRYKFDAAAAQGALLASRWNLPERIRLQKVLEQEDANKAGIVHPQPIARFREGGSLTLSGSLQLMPKGAMINGRPPLPSTQSGMWIVQLPYVNGSGAIKLGENLIKVTTGKNTIVDSFYIFVAEDTAEERRALEERRLVRQYVDSKNLNANDTNKIDIQDLIIDNGMLRQRQGSDPVSIRVNERGEPLSLRLLTTDAPAAYRAVAEEIASQWAQLGVQVKVEVPSSPQEFQDRLLRRDYDVLLFGQSLLDNLDSYPYWHSSGKQKLTGNDRDLRRDAYNLSQYSSFQADQMLETVRATSNEKERQDALGDLRDVLKNDVPAIFLYSPLYIYAHHKDIYGIELGALSLHSDRFLTLYKWYVKQERVFRPGISWLSFFGWLPNSF